MNQLDILRESLGQCDEILLDALLMRNRIVEDIMVYKEANDIPILQPEHARPGARHQTAPATGQRFHHS